jgi:poly-gamma-glutamate synthesis protein (capsule biosynthesis protein)
MESKSIIIGGDLGPTKSNHAFFAKGRVFELIDRQLATLLASADLRIFNLEVPLTDNEQPIAKDGPCLIAPSNSINGIKSVDPSLVTLANNHIMDQGETGLLNTMKLLSEKSIRFAGAGENLKTAAEPVILEINGLKIGIYACAENEFSIAETDKPGANPFDPLESPDHIYNLKSECDYVVVLHHGGKEHYRYPSPELQKVCRKMISSGADLVVCQHSHCVGAYEKLENGTIVYGQGNFLFDRHDNEFWNTGLLVAAKLEDKMTVEFIPIVKNGNGVAWPDPETGERILNDFYRRSEEIKNPEFVERQFDKYCMEYGQYYLATLAGFGTTMRRIDKVLNRPLTRLIYSRKKLNIIENHFECETHREMILRYIRILKGRKRR